LIQRVIDLAQLQPEANLLEIGCGPGIATVTWAELGFSVVALEPSLESCQIARRNCEAFERVSILNTAFEEWQLEPEAFDAVVAATSIHWIPPEVAYPKSAIALKETGSLILLWNMTMQPHPELFAAFQPVYDQYAPGLGIYETRSTQEASLAQLGAPILESGHFTDLTTEILSFSTEYTVDDYLGLLSTYSPYLKLAPETQQALFGGLRQVIQEKVGDRLELNYLSALQVAHRGSLRFEFKY
jgi:SAM-dependent methyltransferase